MSAASLGPARSRSGWNPLTIAALAAAWIALFANWPLWRALAGLPEMGSGRGTLFIGGFMLFVAAVTFALLALFAWRWSVKPAASVLLIAAAASAHFMGSYGIVIDPSMMVNVLQTDTREVRDLMSWRLLASLLLLAGIPLFAMWRMRLKPAPALRQAARNGLALVGSLVLVGAIVLALFADLSATMRNHRTLRYLINPLNGLFSLAVIATEGSAKPTGPPLPIGLDATVRPRPAGIKPPLLMLAIGETARADHFALNGYARPTDPELAALPVTSFRDVSSCGTNTAASLPCMFSSLGKKGFESRGRDHENLLDLLQRAGFAVLWIDNQAGCKGLCERVPNVAAEALAAAAGSSLCGADGECLDEALLVGLDARLAALPAARREQGVVLVLHQMGSHGPAYFRRSPPDRKPFQPECATNLLQQCDRAALVNAYDNSIAYTDHVLALGIAWLKRQAPAYEPALWYLSDHGESLGENNLYLHGLPYALAPAEQTHVPLLMWFGGSAASGAPDAACLQAQRDVPLSHDNLFHTALGWLGVTAREYRPALDALAPCRRR